MDYQKRKIVQLTMLRNMTNCTFQYPELPEEKKNELRIIKHCAISERLFDDVFSEDKQVKDSGY